MAFKPESDDIRDSLSYKLGKLLRFAGARVLYSDEFAKDPTFIAKEELIRQADVVVIGVPHKAYQGIVFRPGQMLVNAWASPAGVS